MVAAGGIIPARAGFTPGEHVDALPPRWIIPARAGFTGQDGDLPVESDGSSPLARGLPAGGLPGDAESGIIPARAGFT